MDAETLEIFQKHIISVPGGRDQEERPVIAIHIPVECNYLKISSTLKYVVDIFSEESKKTGFTVVVDARKCPWRVARSCINQVNSSLTREELSQFIVLRPDAFWDKQRVESCTSMQKDGQVIFVPRTRLFKYVDQAQLPIELGGYFIFNGDQWLGNRTKVEEFFVESETCFEDLRDIQEKISNMYTLNASQIQNNHQLVMDRLEIMQIVTNNCIEKGRELIQKIEYDNRNRKFASKSESMSTPQDIIDTIDKLESTVGAMRRKVIDLEAIRKCMKKSYVDTKDLSFLEDGVAKVTNWILGPAEEMLKANFKIGYDVASAEQLRREHENIEMHCWNAYGAYAELIYKIDQFSKDEFLTVQQKDLISQKDFMDFVCRSFANRLERRRNILITSLRFFRLVAEYFDKTGEVFDSLIMGNKIDDLSEAANKLKQLRDNQIILELVEKYLVKEGEKLGDILSMPIKDALGREIISDYSDDITNIKDILDATTARKNIFVDSVELQKLTLEQVTYIYQYELDARQAIEWLDELLSVLLRHHSHVGCAVNEIQAQKAQHQVFLQTAKWTYNYGFQLLKAAAALRYSCKISNEDNEQLFIKLNSSWECFANISQEQMTRLRVSVVFHRSVEDQCNQLRELREAVATMPLMDVYKKRVRVKQYFGSREKLLVEVGRMVRLGKLLRSRLKEPLFVSNCDSNEMNDGNSSSHETESVSNLDMADLENGVAIEAITEKLSEITELAEELDHTLKSAQQDCAISPSASILNLSAIRKTNSDTLPRG